MLRIRTLRAAGRYVDALQIGRDYRAGLLQRPEHSPEEISDLERVIETLECIRDLPAWAQEEMAEADSLLVEWVPLWYMGKYSLGAELHRRRLEISRRHLGEHHPEVAACLHGLAACLSHAGDYAEAEPLFRETLAMRSDLYGQVHPEVARTLEYLGELYAAVGDDRAEQFYQDALVIWIACGGCPVEIERTRSDVIRLWARMAKLHIEQGDYAEAMPWLRNGLAAFRGHVRAENWLTGMLLDHQAVVLWKQGEYAAAVPLFREALRMRLRDLGAEHPHTIQSLNALGAVLIQCGEPDVAEPLLREALERFRNIRGEAHPDIASALLSLATLTRSKGNGVAADSLCRKALAICRQSRGDEHVDVARCLQQLATTRMVQGRLREAEAGFREALTICEGLLGEDHPDVVQTRHDLARCLLAQDRLAPAESLLSEAAAAFEMARLHAGSGYARATFQASPFATLAAARLMLGEVAEAWPATERAHGRALADLLVRAGQRSLSSGERAWQDSLGRCLGSLEAEVAGLDEAARREDSAERAREFNAARARLAVVEAAWYRLQAEIDSRHPVTEGQAFSLPRVQSVLTDRTALIGWLHVEIGPAEPVSWGYVIRNQGPVQWARLDSSSGSEEVQTPAEQARDFRDALAIASSWLFRPTAVARITGDAAGLWQRWVAPLTPYLKGVERLVVVPAGPMLGIPIEALVDGEGHHLGSRYTVSYAPSATVYTWFCEAGHSRIVPRTRRALLLGDPPFTAEQLAAMERERERNESHREALLASAVPPLPATALRSALAGHPETLDSLPRLPWTREEVEHVGSMLPAATILLGPDASEQQLTAMAESGALREFDIIHLATHALVDDALPEHSALVLSRMRASEGRDPGREGTQMDSHNSLLTVREIVREWELDADLVTLSGCQTGLGRETAAEGYIGLASAFLQVGARSVLVSLWKVEEEATSRLMIRFYENLTGGYDDQRAGRRREPMSKASALRDAKRWLRSYTDTHGNQPFRHPTYWSGFVLIGEP